MRVEVDGVKVSRSVRTALERDWGKNTAKELYNAKRMISRYDFHMVWWDGVERALTGFPKTFRNFVTKQTSKFCDTNRQLSRYDPTVENVCPSCGRRDEVSKHITRRKEEGRTKLWKKSVQEIGVWIGQPTSDLLLRDMIVEYLKAQGEKTMAECLHVRSPQHLSLVETHDKLG